MRLGYILWTNDGWLEEIHVAEWSQRTRKRADRDHRRKKLAKQQKQHLRAVKTEKQLRAIRLGSRYRQR